VTAVDAHPAPAVSDRQIVCVGFNDWGAEVWTNQHHLMACLAAANRVLFVESLGLRRPTLAGRDLTRMARRLRRGLAGPRRVELPDHRGALHVLSPLVLPAHSSVLAQRVNRFLLPRLVGRAAATLGTSDPILWSYVPQAEVLLDRLRPALLVYHCVDDIAAHPRIDTASFRAAERRFAKRADLVLTSSAPLTERMAQLSDNVHYLPNVADTDLFATAREDGPVDPVVAALPEPRIIFTGAIVSTKLDVALITALARRRPDWSIVLVGPVGLGDPLTDASALTEAHNVHLLPTRVQRELPAVLRGARAAIIPYLLNDLTASIFPMKVYEYLAAGLPTVATRLPSLIGTEGITFASDAAGFDHALEDAMAQDGPQARVQRAQLAAGHSWDDRLAEIGELVEAASVR
jgi:glycosyltransferase involved in cell wall biosynthesis